MNVLKSKYLCLIGMIAVLLSSCSVSRHLPEGGYLLDEVKVVSEENPKVLSSLKPQVRQQPNIRTFGLFRLPLRIYCLTGNKDHLVNRVLRNIGEPPRVYDEALARKSCEAMEQTLVNQGYLKAKVDSEVTYEKHRAEVNYYAHPGKQYRVASLNYVCADSVILGYIMADSVNSAIEVGMPFDANILNSERTRMAIAEQRLLWV